MKQIVMTGPGKSKVVEVPDPVIYDDQILVKVTYTGMCHSEWYPWSVAKAGETFGHESVGVVAAVGKNVCGFKKGDRVNIRFSIDGRRWDGPNGVRYFTDLTGWKIDVINADGTATEPVPQPPEAPEVPADAGDPDDLPF